MDTAADGCSDVFVLGSLMWESLARRRLQTSDPHGPGSPRMPAPINQHIPLGGEPIPSAFAEVITRALQPDRELRYAGYRELRDALAGVGIGSSSRREVAAFLQSLLGARSRAEPLAAVPAGSGTARVPRAVASVSEGSFAFEERITAETLALLPDVPADLLSVPEPSTEFVALARVIDSSHAPPPVVITNQPPREGARLRRRVQIAVLAASAMAAAIVIAVLSQGSPAGAERQDHAAVSAAAAAPASAPIERVPVVTPPSAQRPPAPVAAPAAVPSPAPPAASAAGTATAVDAPAAPVRAAVAPQRAAPPVKARPAPARKPPKPRPFTPDDI